MGFPTCDYYEYFFSSIQKHFSCGWSSTDLVLVMESTAAERKWLSSLQALLTVQKNPCYFVVQVMIFKEWGRLGFMCRRDFQDLFNADHIDWIADSQLLAALWRSLQQKRTPLPPVIMKRIWNWGRDRGTARPPELYAPVWPKLGMETSCYPFWALLSGQNLWVDFIRCTVS